MKDQEVKKEIIQGYEVEFEPILHQYFVNGKQVPSISQICKMENPDIYNGIDQATLNRAAAKGVSLHEEIENYELHGEMGYTTEFHHYLKIKKQYGFKKELTERMVIIEIDGQVVCAGRFDLLATMNGKTLLIDFKRTSQIHQTYVTLQLNLYRLGLMQSYGIPIDQLMVIRLRYDAVEILDLPIQELETKHKLRKYLKTMSI
jgi:ABC-type microcin C transport system permease subunit YejB